MPLFWSFVQMLYCPTEKEMHYDLGRPEQMFLDVNIREVSLAHWGVPKCTRWHCSWLPWTLINHAAQNSSFLLNADWVVTLEKQGDVHLPYILVLSLSLLISFSHLKILLTIGVTNASCFPVWIISIVLPVVTFLLITKQEADVEAINTAHYLDKNLSWQQFTLELPSQMQESVCDLIK